MDADLASGASSSTHENAWPVPLWVQWGTLGIFFLFFALSIVDRLVLSLLVEPIKADLRVSDFEFGLLSGVAFALFFFLFSLPVGWAVDRYSRRVVIFLGVCVFSLASAAGGLSRSFSQLFAARVMVGAGEASIGPGAYAMLADVFAPGRLALAIAICGIGATLGISLAYFGGGVLLQWLTVHGPRQLWLIGAVQPWQMVFLICGALGLLVAPLIFLIPERPRQGSTRAHEHGSTAAELRVFVVRHRKLFACHLIGTGLMQAALTGPLTWNAALLFRTYGWTPSEVGLWLGVEALLVSFAGLTIHGAMVDWMFRRGVQDAHVRWCASVSAVAAPLGIAAYFMPTAPATIVLFGCYHILLVGNGSVPPAALQIISPRHLRGKVSSIYLMVTMLLGAAGPAFVAAITDFVFADEKRLGASLAIASVVMSAGASVLFAIARKPMRAAIADQSRAGSLPCEAKEG